VGFIIFMNMIEKYLLEKYSKYLKGLSIYENKTSLILSKIIINDETRNEGIGTKILNDLIDYADKNKQIIALTPSSDYGGNKNRLIQFYKKFGFKHNKGQYKSFELRDSMIRYPKMNETKNIIKKLLKEGLMENNKVDAKIIADFINFTKEYLGIDDDIKVALAFERTPDITTTAYYDLKGFIKIYVKDRAIMDICRSIAHEFVHHKQNLDGRLVDAVKDGQDGTDIENEANAVAGIIIRKWGKLHPELYS
jgi:N-acetylglutamate synthase-like GNAT family acetyltransferase